MAPDKEAFVMHVAYLGVKILIHPAQKPQITLLLAKNEGISEECADFSDNLCKKSAAILSKHLNINKYRINLKPGK